MAISPKAMAALGWTALRRVPNTCGRGYVHTAGWSIQHCGHPTANWPYLLVDPNGEWVLMGAQGVYRNPDYGRAWRTVEQAVEYVAQIGLTRKELLQICRW